MASEDEAPLERAYPYRSGWQVIACSILLCASIGALGAGLVPFGCALRQDGQRVLGSVVAAFGLNFKAVSGAGWAHWAQLGVGVVLIGEGVLLVSDWQAARRLLLRRLYERFHGRDAGKPPRLRLWYWKVLGQALVFAGIVWIAVGAFETAQALRALL
jgi:hypothetical protein